MPGDFGNDIGKVFEALVFGVDKLFKIIGIMSVIILGLLGVIAYLWFKGV